MPASPIVQTLLILVLSGGALSLWKGGTAERVGAGLILGNLFLTMVAANILSAESRPVGGLVIDGLTAVGLLVIALRYASLWLGGVMLLYAVQFSLRAFYFVTDRPHDRFHAIVNNIDFMGIILCMVIGTAVAWRRRVVANRTAA